MAKIEFDIKAAFWQGSFIFVDDDSDEREATQAEVEAEFDGIVTWKRNYEDVWFVQGTLVDLACTGAERGWFELQRGDVVLRIRAGLRDATACRT